MIKNESFVMEKIWLIIKDKSKTAKRKNKILQIRIFFYYFYQFSLTKFSKVNQK